MKDWKQHHYKQFIASLKAAGIVYELYRKGKERIVRILPCSGPNNLGWACLYTEFVFDATGVLLAVGTWEAAAA